MNASLIHRAEALADRAAQAAITAALARHAGHTDDADLWEARATRLELMADDYRRKAN